MARGLLHHPHKSTSHSRGIRSPRLPCSDPPRQGKALAFRLNCHVVDVACVEVFFCPILVVPFFFITLDIGHYLVALRIFGNWLHFLCFLKRNNAYLIQITYFSQLDPTVLTYILLKIYRGNFKPQIDLGIYFSCLAPIPMRPPKSLDSTIKLSQLEFL